MKQPNLASKKNLAPVRQMFLWHCEFLHTPNSAPFEVPFQEWRKDLTAYTPEEGWGKFYIPFAAAFIEWKERTGKGFRSFVRALTNDTKYDYVEVAKEMVRIGLREMRQGCSLPLLLSLYRGGSLTPYDEPWSDEDLEWITREGVASASRFPDPRMVEYAKARGLPHSAEEIRRNNPGN